MSRDNIETIAEISMLFDFYGELLPKKQREVFRLYHEDNFSLGEIGEDYGITRQGVYDFLKRGETSLLAYEEKLGLVERFRQAEVARRKADAAIDCLIGENEENRPLTNRLKELKEVIRGIDL